MPVTRIVTTAVLLMLAAAIAPTASAAPCAKIPRVRPIDHACLPAGRSPARIPVYRGEGPGDYVEIAYVDSYSCLERDEETVKAQLEDLDANARAAGADGLIRLKQLAIKKTGFVNNPRTPFPSVQQGETKYYFFRAVAIKYKPGGRQRPR